MGRGAAAPPAGGPLDRIVAAATAHLGGDGGVAIAALIFVLIAAKAGLGLAYALVSSAVRTRLSEAVRNGLHRRYLEIPYADFRRHDQGHLLDLLATSSWSVADAGMAAARVLVNACSIVVFGAFLLGLSWRITAAAAVGSVALFLALHRLRRRARRAGRADQGREPRPRGAHAGRAPGHADHPRLRAGGAVPGRVRADLGGGAPHRVRAGAAARDGPAGHRGRLPRAALRHRRGGRGGRDAVRHDPGQRRPALPAAAARARARGPPAPPRRARAGAALRARDARPPGRGPPAGRFAALPRAPRGRPVRRT